MINLPLHTNLVIVLVAGSVLAVVWAFLVAQLMQKSSIVVLGQVVKIMQKVQSALCPCISKPLEFDPRIDRNRINFC